MGLCEEREMRGVYFMWLFMEVFMYLFDSISGSDGGSSSGVTIVSI